MLCRSFSGYLPASPLPRAGSLPDRTSKFPALLVEDQAMVVITRRRQAQQHPLDMGSVKEVLTARYQFNACRALSTTTAR